MSWWAWVVAVWLSCSALTLAGLVGRYAREQRARRDADTVFVFRGRRS